MPGRNIEVQYVANEERRVESSNPIIYSKSNSKSTRGFPIHIYEDGCYI